MRTFALAFLLGVVLLQHFIFLPSPVWTWVLIFFASTILFFNRKIFFLAAFMLGFAWALWFAHARTSWNLPHELEGKTVTVTGTIASIPNRAEFGTGFLFSLKNFNEQPVHGLIHLSWRADYQHLQVGEEWQLSVHLKKIHGTMNPGGFDYEAWALEEGIRANGYVLIHAKNKLLSNHWYQYPLNRARQYLKEKIEKNLPVSNTSPWITALVVGERHGINQENWQVLRNTGTNHLMAIAGLHIGFMSGFAFSIVAWCWRRFPKLTLIIPSQFAGSIAALTVALVYSALAGFSIPTQRACLMLSVFLIIVLLRRNTLSWQAWSIAILSVLLLNPLTVLSESFWLSFGSVALIIYGVSGRLSSQGLWWKWGRIQWVIGVGLIPFSIWLFQQFSLVSFIANSIAIPWVGFLIVPLCLCGSFCMMISEKTGGLILLLADKLLAILWCILAWLSHLSWASWYQVMPNYWILITACIGIVILLVPAGFPGRFFGIMGLLPLLFYQPATPKLGEMWFTLLDVGQGLSAVVQTQNHLLIFDTGPKLSVSFDMGESVVVPFLHTLGSKRIDMLVVSHGDNDHIGGSGAILDQFPVAEIKTSTPEKFTSKNVSYCLRGESWTWDNVSFSFLHPSADKLNLGNNSSCVLKIATPQQSVLLAGDIEKLAENLLVEQENNLAADILVAPHHGSKTSAVAEFLQKVNPRFVLFAVGYRNRYRFPNVSVIEKYQELVVTQHDTANDGAIEFKPELMLYRKQHHHYWNN